MTIHSDTQSTLSLLAVMSICDGLSKPMRKKVIKKAVAHGVYEAVVLLDEFYSKNKLAAWYVIAIDCAKQVKRHIPDLIIRESFLESAIALVDSVDPNDIKYEVIKFQKQIDAMCPPGGK